MTTLPDIEMVSAKVHDAWMAQKRAAGVTSRKLESGEELMVPYENLSEQAKQLDRGTVQAVYAAIEAATVTAPSYPGFEQEADLRKVPTELYVSREQIEVEIESELEEIGSFEDEYQGMSLRRAFEKLRAKRKLKASDISPETGKS